MPKLVLLITLLLFALAVNAQQVNLADTVPAKYRGLKKRSPLVAFALSTCIPGTGQFYNRQYTKGGIVLGAIAVNLVGILATQNDKQQAPYVGDYRFNFPRDMFITLAACTWIYSFVDAPMTAPNLNVKYHLAEHRTQTFSHIRFSPTVMSNYDIGKPIFGFKLSLK